MGEADRIIRSTAIGIGCVMPDPEMIETDTDMLICCYDGRAIGRIAKVVTRRVRPSSPLSTGRARSQSRGDSGTT
ncbi:MAG: hypothetical protein KBA64_06170 [Armatimonadetes bacterium]|jgi:hypothetical protein|nr:hypothetical protein [Armatimonadota bacterium]MDI9601950.1 hypothetical protein [Acidobacteriota bacterium]